MYWIYYFLGMWYYQKKKDYKKAQSYFLRVLKRREKHAKCNFKLGMSYFKLKQWKEANEFISKALIIDPSKKSWHTQLKQTENHLNNMFFRSQKLWWKEVEDLKRQIQDKEKNFFICRDLAIALENMKRYHEAASYYEQAVKLSDKKESILYYKLGYCYESKGHDSEPNIELAQKYYNKAIKYDDKLDAKKFGIGVFHENQGLWKEANEAYLEYYKQIQSLENEDLLYKIAFSFEKLYDWNNAEIYYKEILKYNYQNSHVHYRLAYVLERQNKLEECLIYYKECSKRASEFPRKVFFKIGEISTKLDRSKEAAKFFSYTRDYKDMSDYKDVSFQKNTYFYQKCIYAEFYESEEIVDTFILYQSHTAKNMSCNSYAIFKYLLQLDDFRNYIHIWAIDDTESIPKKYKRLKNVILVKPGSVLYLKYLACAKYLINSGSFFRFFIRKKGQKYLATWHGTPLKFLGKDMKRGFLDYEVTQKDFLQSTHIIVPNKHTAKVLIDRHDISEIYLGMVYESGYPRIDATINITDAEKKSIKEQLGIEDDRKIILYAPTYRNSFEKAEVNFKQVCKDIEVLQKNTNYIVLYRGHYTTEKNTNILHVPRNIDTNELLAIVDVLITDYSSIFFDFMVLERPIIFYGYDYERYKNEHGLYFDYAKLECQNCLNIFEVIRKLNDPVELKKCIIKSDIAQNFIGYEDGSATKRVVDMFFFDAYDSDRIYKKNITEKKQILISSGLFAKNGITSSFLNFINAIDLNSYSIYLAVDTGQLREKKEVVEKLRKLNEKIYILGNPNVISQTIEESYLLNHPVYKISRVNEEQEKIFSNIFSRDFRCLYGESKFDAVVSFDGYSELWVYRFAYAETDAKKIIYLHNDMLGEYKIRFPYLEKIFNMYKYFDYIFSVSQELSDLNRDSLSSLYGIPKHKFDYMNNIISDDDILFKSNFRLECQDDELLYEEDYKVFVTIGRLSPEKNHINLIQAFSKFHQSYSKTRLIILGDGPLKEELQEYIRKNSLDNCIFMLGIKNNPYPYLKKANCFILSSLHEGQPMVLLESLVLSKPIIATNILGNKSVLKNFGGILVEKDVEGIISGLNSFMKGHVDIIKFDSKKYNQEILNKFNKLFKVNSAIDLKKKNKINAPCIIMAKPDGFGMRLFSLMAGMIIAEKIDFSFYFKWGNIEDVIGNIDEMFSSKNHIPFALGKVEEIFDEKFIHKYYIENQEVKSNHGFGIHQKCKNFDDIQNGYYEQPWGWYSPGIEGGALSQWINGYKEEQCYKDFGRIYKKIQFSEKFSNIVNDAQNVADNIGEFISIHIRGGDIVFSSNYKQTSLYGFVGDKYFPYEIAIDIIENELQNNRRIIIFSQDINSSKSLIEYFKDSRVLLADTFASKYNNITQRAFFEINLMSHSLLIYTPGISLQKSAFSQCASFISGVKKDISYHELFTKQQQFDILNKNIQKIKFNVLYDSMSYFRLFQLSIELGYDISISSRYIDQAIDCDKTNIGWIIQKIYLMHIGRDYNRMEKYIHKEIENREEQFFNTLFMFNGRVYQHVCDNLLEIKKYENYPYICYLIVKIYLFRKDKQHALDILEKYWKKHKILKDELERYRG
ncbi:glycosyltransferase, family 1 (tetratricopeptide repeat protein) [Campylobacter subantarcticus LMG 24374]|uniref:Glycosyltransferase, family 1 (Tetratricopeptide repeat protein) n=2 Tax=Campylobacter subantarcticus TaxID=497724 RepID=A0A0A8H7Y8_9BACT|nr:CDP-glycerol glycerophosphotransferase family protein [Campylobacter subantarcticus]AJC90206.1 glycosyltransferase, family 1 (tetratricopeptide repeat protein) [Campylobacter subantarcticus LMG 24374]EAJ1261684.1 glycosyltransferase [Campylobacter lari]